MPRSTRRSPGAIASLVVVVLLGFAGCSDERPARGNDTVMVGEPPPGPAELLPTPIAWDTAAGLLFAVSAGAPGQAHLVDPAFSSRDRLDTLRISGARVDDLELQLFAGGDSVGTARVVSLAEVATAQCVSWPVADLAPLDSSAGWREWRVGFPRERVTALAELINWTVMHGAVFDGNNPAAGIQNAADDSITNLILGFRYTLGTGSFAATWSRALSQAVWQEDLMRLEYRRAY